MAFLDGIDTITEISCGDLLETGTKRQSRQSAGSGAFLPAGESGGYLICRLHSGFSQAAGL